MEPIKPLLLSCLSPPDRGIYTIYTCLLHSTPASTRRAIVKPGGYCAVQRRIIEAAPLACAAKCGSLAQVMLVEGNVRGLVRALEADMHGLILSVVYLQGRMLFLVAFSRLA